MRKHPTWWVALRGGGETAAEGRDAGPTGPDEWERTREHLPWHLPTVHA